MKQTYSSETDAQSYARNNLNAARPLLQAILLGMLLAAILVAAAALAKPSGLPQSVSETGKDPALKTQQGY